MKKRQLSVYFVPIEEDICARGSDFVIDPFYNGV